MIREPEYDLNILDGIIAWHKDRMIFFKFNRVQSQPI